MLPRLRFSRFRQLFRLEKQSSSFPPKIMKLLAVFDFDHTILDDNSDTAVFDLVDKDSIPQEIKQLQYSEGWTSFMQGVFTYLKEQGVTVEDIKSHVKNLPPVVGMVDLILRLKKQNDDLVIISDSNSIFIKIWLENHGLEKCFMKVFTNPAEISEGMFKISPYHNQETCKLSTKNLCKGQVLDNFLEKQTAEGIIYDKVVYIGDGVNDFCPILHLKLTDLACARNNCKLCQLVNKAKNGQSMDNTGQIHNIKPELLVWDTGDDISRHLGLIK